MQSFDLPTLFQGLKSRTTASRPEWLRQLLFSPSALGMLAWRLVVGAATYILILTFYPLPPCNSHYKPVDSWYKVCAAAAEEKWYVWRPKCWGCSMFDRYYAIGHLQEGHAVVAVMVLSAGLFLLVMLCGLLGLRRLLGRVCILPKASAAFGKSSVAVGGAADPADSGSSVQCPQAAWRSHPAEVAKQHPLIESKYQYALTGPVVQQPAVLLHSKPSAHRALLAFGAASSGSQSCNASLASGTARLQVHVCDESDSGIQKSGIATGTYMLPTDTPLANKTDDTTGMLLMVQLVMLATLIAVGDVVVFNCHWLVQLALLIVGIAYCSWLHVGFLIRSLHTSDPQQQSPTSSAAGTGVKPATFAAGAIV